MGPTPHTTWLTFEVDFAFKSPLYRQVASIFFEEVRCWALAGAALLGRPGRSGGAASLAVPRALPAAGMVACCTSHQLLLRCEGLASAGQRVCIPVCVTSRCCRNACRLCSE
jgi:hypothetical protein